MTYFDLNTITWGNTPNYMPNVFDTLYYEVEEDNEHFKARTEFFLSLVGEPGSHGAELTVVIPEEHNSKVYNTDYTRQWPFFDRTFGGRKVWQDYLDQQLPILIDAFGIDEDDNEDDDWEY